MQNLQITQITDDEIRQLLREELEAFFSEKTIENKTTSDELGGIELAIELTGLAKPTIYSLVSLRKIPHSKRGKKLYFSRHELLTWLANGKRKTTDEIAEEAANFTVKRKEAIQPAKTRNRFHNIKRQS